MVLKTLYVNGLIFTSNSEIPYAEAMSVSLGVIDYVGTTQGLMERIGLSGLDDPGISEFEVIDLKGKTVVPGFVDADIRPLLNTPEMTSLMQSATDFTDAIMSLGQELSKKGIVGLGIEGNFGDKDAFELLMNLGATGLNQSLALYYPVEYAMNHPELAEDKQRLVRNRKVHIAGLTLPVQEDVTEEMYEFALQYCNENSLQLSAQLGEDGGPTDLITSLMSTPSWMEEMEIPHFRVHKGLSGFTPFVKIKSDLEEEVVTRGPEAEGEKFGLDDHVIGYTKYAAAYNGFTGIGEIAVGKSASFLILNRDLTSIPVAELDQVEPETTVIEGRIAYNREF